MFEARKRVAKNGKPQRLGRPVSDLRQFSKMLAIGLYRVPIQGEVFIVCHVKKPITIVDTVKLFYQWPLLSDDVGHQAIISHQRQEVLCVVDHGQR